MNIKLFLSTSIVAGLGLIFAGSAPVQAGTGPVAIYPYASSENYCPSGLQPIVLNGIICCGTPNQSVSYREMLRHPSGIRRVTTRRTVCPVGEKGCVTR